MNPCSEIILDYPRRSADLTNYTVRFYDREGRWVGSYDPRSATTEEGLCNLGRGSPEYWEDILAGTQGYT